MNLLVAFLALLIDRLLPPFAGLTRRLGHPVIWQGALISFLEKHLNRPSSGPMARRAAGLLMLAVLVLATGAVCALLSWQLRRLPAGWVLEAALASIFLAHTSLAGAVARVADALDVSDGKNGAIAAARQAVSMIVGRDTGALDRHEIARAAIESLAENASDGIIAPLFWLVLFGLPGIGIYKAINTADSMVGHLSARYRDFGWASARLDDLVNLVPSRLTALLFALAAFFLAGASPSGSWRAAMGDAPAHLSPNAGWPEAALAGALGFSLGGPRAYQGQVHDLARMGDGRRDLGAADIRLALKLFGRMTALALGATGLLSLIWQAPVWVDFFRG